jgi:hypothetical protein
MVEPREAESGIERDEHKAEHPAPEPEKTETRQPNDGDPDPREIDLGTREPSGQVRIRGEEFCVVNKMDETGRAIDAEQQEHVAGYALRWMSVDHFFISH